MVARHVDAIAISATDRDALVAPVRRAMQAGIPVTVFDSGLAIDDYVTFVATDNYGAGQTAARQLAALIGGKGNIGVIMQRPGGQSTTEREKGFSDTIAKEYPEVRTADSQFGMGDPAISRSTAENILTAHPNLVGLFASAEASSIGAIQAIKVRGLGGKIKLVGFDFSDAHRQALQEGIMDATLVQDTYHIGYEAVRSLALKLGGKTPPKRVDLPARVVRKQDLNAPGSPVTKGS
jgi:ribose transport system substrate-binding protein